MQCLTQTLLLNRQSRCHHYEAQRREASRPLAHGTGLYDGACRRPPRRRHNAQPVSIDYRHEIDDRHMVQIGQLLLDLLYSIFHLCCLSRFNCGRPVLRLQPLAKQAELENSSFTACCESSFISVNGNERASYELYRSCKSASRRSVLARSHVTIRYRCPTCVHVIVSDAMQGE
ncbi:unnamed protein product [Soboliphyme baturini]|uniref:Uncharacterized protein n=1 Tax=Soboliphyme baturini TaxID=241478 RepID=A0A183IH99_9BILA|nr:unnamed protein product [Soboliphyme baturini]